MEMSNEDQGQGPKISKHSLNRTPRPKENPASGGVFFRGKPVSVCGDFGRIAGL